jgi:hypothetical protein
MRNWACYIYHCSQVHRVFFYCTSLFSYSPKSFSKKWKTGKERAAALYELIAVRAGLYVPGCWRVDWWSWGDAGRVSS